MKALTPETAKLVRINWQDILFEDSWNDDQEPVQPVECMTVGFLIEDTPTMITVAGSYDYRAEQWATIHSFPKGKPTKEELK